MRLDCGMPVRTSSSRAAGTVGVALSAGSLDLYRCKQLKLFADGKVRSGPDFGPKRYNAAPNQMRRNFTKVR